MAVFRAVVETVVGPMSQARGNLSLGRPIRHQLVFDDTFGNEAETLCQAAQQRFADRLYRFSSRIADIGRPSAVQLSK